MRRLLSRCLSLPYLPYPHFMALAPLDVWLRLLLRPPAAIPLRYWPRLFFALACSVLSTVVTLPERILLAFILRLQRAALNASQAPVFILGYYRSGTTHLQYLLNQDPNLFSPTWVHTLAPQGFVASWTFLRFFLIPFMPSTRLVDPMLFGPEMPSEDDFALNNWALASTLPGRAVLTRAYRFYDRFHDLRDLTPAERSRWRRCQLAFVRKLSLLSGKRRLVLKTPSHTARVEVLLQLFPHAKFIHISREPMAVIRSNMGLLQAVQRIYTLQDPPAPEEIEQNLVRQYLATEKRYLEARSKIPKGQLAELRFQDLLGDPIGEIRRIYGELDLAFSDRFERRLIDYLSSSEPYTPNVHSPWTGRKVERLQAQLISLAKQFRHDQPNIPPVALSRKERLQDAQRTMAALAGLVTALACALAWLLMAHLTHSRLDWLVWPTGIAIGYSTLQVAQAGSRNLGLGSLFLTLLVLLCVAFANTRFIDYAADPQVPWSTLLNRTARKLSVEAHLFWAFMGMLTAFRLGSRRRA